MDREPSIILSPIKLQYRLVSDNGVNTPCESPRSRLKPALHWRSERVSGRSADPKDKGEGAYRTLVRQ